MSTAEKIRNLEKFEKSLRCFDTWLGDTVSGAMDVDCLIERNNNFLFLEAKPWQRGVAMGFGQHLTLERLSNQPSTTVLLVGEHGDELYLAEMGAKQPIIERKGRLTAFYWPKMFRESNVDGLRAYVQDWWSSVSGRL